MDKTQFIEKTIKEIKNSKFITALAITLPSDVYDVFLKMLEGVLDSKLSECWDMAGEEKKKKDVDYSFISGKGFDEDDYTYNDFFDDSLTSKQEDKKG